MIRLEQLNFQKNLTTAKSSSSVSNKILHLDSNNIFYNFTCEAYIISLTAGEYSEEFNITSSYTTNFLGLFVPF